ncbi:MAG: hypothetical protein NKF70_02960 [Methanobacterium sp. ERen5]|nr:MAG: hypothetical protein NKF70_02960 [Methanobacterium sp. ERen5]
MDITGLTVCFGSFFGFLDFDDKFILPEKNIIKIIPKTEEINPTINNPKSGGVAKPKDIP